MNKDFITMNLSIEDVYHDYKLVADSIVDDESYQKADTGILLSNLYDVVKALEKQIPKKMNPNFNCIHCDCGNPIYYQTDRLLHHYNYCCECGQAIKWE